MALDFHVAIVIVHGLALPLSIFLSSLFCIVSHAEKIDVSWCAVAPDMAHDHMSFIKKGRAKKNMSKQENRNKSKPENREPENKIQMQKYSKTRQKTPHNTICTTELPDA